MDENTSEQTQGQEKTEVQKEVPKDESTNAKRPTVIEEARTENDRKEKLLEQEKDLQDRRESFEAERMLGGNAEAGGETTKKEETPKEYAHRILEGK